MATTDRLTGLDTNRSITDRFGETVTLGSGKEAVAFDLDATANVVVTSESEAFSAFSIVAAAVYIPVASYIEREYEMDATASFTAEAISFAEAAFSSSATASLATLSDQEDYEMRNLVINGNFDFWQRGTSLAAATASRYLADRWITFAGVNHTIAPSRQAFTLGQTDVPGEPTYFHRSVVVTGAANAGNFAVQAHRFEGVRTLAGQTGRLTFEAKADASKNIAIEGYQHFGTGGGASADVSAIDVQTLALTTSWQKFSINVDVSSISGKTIGTSGTDYLSILFWFSGGSSFNARNGTLGEQAGTFDIAKVQFEAGDVETPFEVRPTALELALCQRFYETAPAVHDSTINTQYNVHYWKVMKRADPTLVATQISGTGQPTYGNSPADSRAAFYQTDAPSSLGTSSVAGDAEL